jgi:hypothetical protein
MLPNLALPYLPISLVFYVDSNTGHLVKPKAHSPLISLPCITSEITEEDNNEIYGFDPTCLGQHLSTEYDINSLAKGWLLTNTPFSVSFCKYPEYYYKYINFAANLIYINLLPEDYEENYGLFPPYINLSDYDLVYDSSPVKCYSYRSQEKSIEIPRICELELTKKCLVIEQDQILYLYVNNVFCGYTLLDSDTWSFIEGSEILESSCVRDLNKLTIKAGKKWNTTKEVCPSVVKNNSQLTQIKQYLINLLSCM